MDEYVAKENVLAKLEKYARDPYHETHYIRDAVINTIRRMEAADVVEVVRCEDCKYWIELEHGTGTCKRLDNVLFWLGTDAIDFCSFAERKDDEID